MIFNLHSHLLHIHVGLYIYYFANIQMFCFSESVGLFIVFEINFMTYNFTRSHLPVISAQMLHFVNLSKTIDKLLRTTFKFTFV